MKLQVARTTTVKELSEALAKGGKAVSKPTLYKYLHALRIEPISKVRQIPQRYPADSAKRILTHLGFKP
jgi:hypothetical protein